MATANGNRTEDAPDPIEHATPDVELAEAQLAVGRPEYVDEEAPADASADEGSVDDEFDDERDPADPGDEEPLDAEPSGDGGGGGYDEGEDDSARRTADPAAGATERRPQCRGARTPPSVSCTSCREAGASCSGYSGLIAGR